MQHMRRQRICTTLANLHALQWHAGSRAHPGNALCFFGGQCLAQLHTAFHLALCQLCHHQNLYRNGQQCADHCPAQPWGTRIGAKSG